MSTTSEHGPVALDPRVDLLAGAVAGVAALTVGFPFDTVKVRLQTPLVARRYASAWHAFATIVREERVRGLFRGIASPLFTVAPLNGVVFASYRFFLKLQLDHAAATPTLTQVTLAGIACGLLASLVTAPTELLKIQQQSTIVPTAAGAHAPSAAAVARAIVRQHGVRALFRGWAPTAVRETGYGAYFGAYEGTLALLDALRRRRLRPSPASTDDGGGRRRAYADLLLAGGVAGVLSWAVTFPFDVVKTRVQSTFDAAPSSPFRTMRSTIAHSYAHDGWRVFFRGLKPTVIRAIPVNMVTFATFETVAHALS